MPTYSWRCSCGSVNGGAQAESAEVLQGLLAFLECHACRHTLLSQGPTAVSAIAREVIAPTPPARGAPTPPAHAAVCPVPVHVLPSLADFDNSSSDNESEDDFEDARTRAACGGSGAQAVAAVPELVGPTQPRPLAAPASHSNGAGAPSGLPKEAAPDPWGFMRSKRAAEATVLSAAAAGGVGFGEEAGVVPVTVTGGVLKKPRVGPRSDGPRCDRHPSNVPSCPGDKGASAGDGVDGQGGYCTDGKGAKDAARDTVRQNLQAARDRGASLAARQANPKRAGTTSHDRWEERTAVSHLAWFVGHPPGPPGPHPAPQRAAPTLCLRW